jgi:cellulose synthase/poly-beta-1,6-N-acetylglucosamine synthase-like glycosyltransferase
MTVGGFLIAVNVFALSYFVLLNGVYLLLTTVALFSLRRYAARLKALDVGDVLLLGGAPPVTLLAPAYNEGPTCVQAVSSLLALDYPEYEVLVVNDGSKDDTLANLTAAFDLQPVVRAPMAEIPTKPIRQVYRSKARPTLWVLDKENGGKADALNAGLNHVRTPLFCAIDADSLLEREALARVVRPFLEDETTVAAGGIIRIANGSTVKSGALSDIRLPRNWLARIQVVEYLRSFLSGRVGWNALGSTLIISGAFGMFKRALVVAVGGYDTTTVGEDMELVVRLHRHCREQKIPYRVSFAPDPVAWTECPESLKILSRQRRRWARGLAEVLWRHKRMILNPRYGTAGMLGMANAVIFDLLGPVIELLGIITMIFLIAFGLVSQKIAIAFILLAFAVGISLSLAAIGLEELTFRRYPRTRQVLVLMAHTFIESIGYHQMMMWFSVQGVWEALRKRTGWGEMTRKGFNTTPARS